MSKAIREATREWSRFDKWCVIAYVAAAFYAIFIHNQL